MNVHRNNWFAVSLLVATLWFVAAVAHVNANEVVVVEVPEGKKVVLVDEKMPDFCVSVKGWKVHGVVEPQEKEESCDELTVSPAAPCSD